MRFLKRLLVFVYFLAGACALADPPPVQVVRFQKPIRDLERLLYSSDDMEVVLKALREKGRGPAFALEELFRLYGKRYDTLNGFENQTKMLTTTLGWYNDSEDHLKEIEDKVEKMKEAAGGKLTPEETTENEKLLAHLRGVRDGKKEMLGQILKSQGWTPSELKPKKDTVLSQVRAALRQTTDDDLWDDSEDDLKFVNKYLRKRIKKHLLNVTFDMGNLQDGLHKFRRELRWVAILLQVLDGAVILEDGDEPLPKRYQGIMNDPIRKSPYSKLRVKPNLDYYLFFPRAYFLVFNKAIKELGVAKDSGEELTEWLPKALRLSEAATTAADVKRLTAKFAGVDPKPGNPQTIAKPIYAAIKGTGAAKGELLSSLVDYLKDQKGLSCEEIYRRAGRGE